MSEDVIRASISKAAEKYAELTGLRAAINLIPTIGGAIDVLITSKGHKMAQERLGRLIQSLKDEMTNVKEALVDKKYLESEEWYDLLMQAFEKSIRTRSEEKIQHYAKILRGSVVISQAREHAEEFLNTLSEMSETEIRIAKALFEVKRIALTEGFNLDSEKQFIQQCTFVDKQDLFFYLRRLERTGLVTEVPGISAVGRFAAIFKITPTFEKLMVMLRGDQKAGKR